MGRAIKIIAYYHVNATNETTSQGIVKKSTGGCVDSFGYKQTF